jgi:hypothetical protein
VMVWGPAWARSTTSESRALAPARVHVPPCGAAGGVLLAFLMSKPYDDQYDHCDYIIGKGAYAIGKLRVRESRSRLQPRLCANLGDHTPRGLVGRRLCQRDVGPGSSPGSSRAGRPLCGSSEESVTEILSRIPHGNPDSRKKRSTRQPGIPALR